MQPKKISLICTFLLARGLPVYRLFHSTVDYRIGHNSLCIAALTGVRLSRAKFRLIFNLYLPTRIIRDNVQRYTRCEKSRNSVTHSASTLGAFSPILIVHRLVIDFVQLQGQVFLIIVTLIVRAI